jgi:hypothetical protein
VATAHAAEGWRRLIQEARLMVMTTPHVWSGRAWLVLRRVLGPDADLSQPDIVAQASERDLRLAFCGKVTLDEIQSWLSAHGTKLAELRNTARPAERSRVRFRPGS